MNELTKLEYLLNIWKNTNVVDFASELRFDDEIYNKVIDNYFKFPLLRESILPVIISRLNSIVHSLDANPNDYIKESLNMWEELSAKGCTKDELDIEKYPLSASVTGNYCALCAYSSCATRVLNMCEVCPVKWSNGTCHDLYYKWDNSKTESEYKINAKALLDEIKNGRIDN